MTHAAAIPRSNWDVFISHAHEDKNSFVRPLARALAELGLSVWYDEFVLKPGDSLRRSIDKGLKSSAHVVAVLSPAFFHRQWSQRELDAVFSREQPDQTILIPVWHNVSAEEVRDFSPMLSDRFAVLGQQPEEAAESIYRVVRPSFSAAPLASGPSIDLRQEIVFRLGASATGREGQGLLHRLEGSASELLPAACTLFRAQFIRERGDEPASLASLLARELLVNAVAHRDYSVPGNIEVEFSSSSVRINSPGCPPAPLTLEHLRCPGNLIVFRNSQLTSELRKAGLMEGMGVGLVRVFATLREHGLPPLEFEQAGPSLSVGIRAP